MRTSPFRVFVLLTGIAPLAASAGQKAAALAEDRAAPAPAKGQLPANFTLGRCIPDDVWMFINKAHNPERDFIDRHWARVFEAVKQSGVDDELKKLITSDMEPAEREKFEQVWQTVAQLYGSVEWCQLASVEFAFAQRFTRSLGPPEMFVLMRGAPEATDANFAALKGILQTVASAGHDSLKLTDEQLLGAQVCGLHIAGPFSFELARRGDVIAVTTGRAATLDVLSLMSGASEKDSGEPARHALCDSPRFQQALSELTSPEDSLAFFDLPALFTSLTGMFACVSPKGGTDGNAEVVMPKILAAAMNEFDIFDYAISTEWTDGMQTRSDNLCRLRSDAAKKPLTKIFIAQKPFEQFDRFLPADVTGFSVSSGWDLTLLYDLVLDFIRKNVPDGENVIREFEGALTAIDFDPKRDLLSWLGGESVSASFAGARTPFGGGGEFVEFMRVKDAELASKKIGAAIAKVNELLGAHGKPALMILDAPEVQAKGFRTLTHPMLAMFIKINYGFSGDWLVIGSSPQAINKCLEAGAGKRPTVASNPRFQKEGIVPDRPIVSAAFKDLTNMGQELGSAFMMAGMFSAFVPDQPEWRPIRAIIGMLNRLAPAFNEINFFSSESSATTFDGRAWRTKTVTTYRHPPAAD